MVQQAVQDGIGNGGVADDGVPVFDWALAGDDGGSFPIAVLDDFEQVVALGIVKRSEEQIVEDEELDFGQAVKRFEMRAIGFGLEQHFKQARSAQIKHGVSPSGRRSCRARKRDNFCPRRWDQLRARCGDERSSPGKRVPRSSACLTLGDVCNRCLRDRPVEGAWR